MTSSTTYAPPITRGETGTAGGRWIRTATMLGLGGLGFRAVDDAFLQSAAAPGDNLLSGLVPLLVCAVAAAVVTRSRGGLRTFATLSAATWGLVGGAELFIESGPRHGGFEADDISGVVSMAAGAVLLVCFAYYAWHAQSRAASRAGRVLHRVAALTGSVALAVVTLFPLGLAYVATHYVGAGLTSAPDLGAPVEKVRFDASDGVELTGWYTAPANGAVVIVVPGKSGVDHARMLVDNGYGVLLVNRRGEADSGGDPHLYGWEGARDVRGAVAFMKERPEVDQHSIAALGLSVGGELAVQAASESTGLSAVISDGAGSRSIKETLELTGGIQWAELSVAPLLTAGLVVLTDQAPPPNLKDRSVALPPTPALFIWGGDGQAAEAQLGRRYAAAAGAVAEQWEVPGAGHVGGIDTAPEDYERHVIDFLDRTLLGESGDGDPS